jgi:hypothetical protein
LKQGSGDTEIHKIEHGYWLDQNRFLLFLLKTVNKLQDAFATVGVANPIDLPQVK